MNRSNRHHITSARARRRTGSTRLTATALAVCALLPGACAAAQQTPQPKNTAKPIAVEVVKPAIQRVVRTLKLPATLAPDQEVDLFAKASGFVADVNVDIGSTVSKGDILATLSIPEMNDQIQQANALHRAKQAQARALTAKAEQARRQVDTARARVQQFQAQTNLDALNLKRTEELHKGNAIPKKALDEARSALAISQAQLDIAKAQVAGAEAEHDAVQADGAVAQADVAVARAALQRLKTLTQYATIKAPFDGTITQRNVDPGAFIRSAAEGSTRPLLHLAQTDRLRLVLEIPETDAAYVRIGTEVELSVPALDELPITATVTRTARAIKPETRTMRAEVDLDNTDGRFAPGMYARTTLKLEIKTQAMVIPSKAIRMHNGQTVVFVSADGIVKSEPIKIGYDDGIHAEILNGLGGDENVITTTSGAISPGSPVRPVAPRS